MNFLTYFLWYNLNPKHLSIFLIWNTQIKIEKMFSTIPKPYKYLCKTYRKILLAIPTDKIIIEVDEIQFFFQINYWYFVNNRHNIIVPLSTTNEIKWNWSIYNCIYVGEDTMIVFNYQDYEITAPAINAFVVMEINNVTNNTTKYLFTLINRQTL